jgi:hypothetical protein
MGGAAARVEAYAVGVPSVHLAVSFDREAWGKPQHALVEVEALQVPEGTVRTPDAYRELARRTLTDGGFAERLVEAQLGTLARVTDARAYWLQLVDAYDRWRRDGG